MEKLAGLDFSNPNNACLSLRVLAELVRQGEIQCLTENPMVGDVMEDKAPEMILGFKGR